MSILTKMLFPLRKLKDAAISSQGLPIVLTLTVISVLFVLFRMKGVETDYKVNTVNAKIEKARLENKELKAQKAGLLSIGNLRKLAKNTDLPNQSRGRLSLFPDRK